ncbi:uncharacterized protein LACBIDRAFT_314927 [Laccaria bicolor S238N-H82]|uniref:Predicted protein n=1 Tax=Laccaria bicolor (strain S238N-H82 / ATCC MYA-4686) TaxID=486041 RepID=B0DZG9_LACBS|nr:uncharacterized protein LACBIDRAFT_314927 [Laccaria bicolor S238N-H82]EDR00017.1 predicted protein [Laccaria bicolor S238N-H82]|eukprot:XP_001889326.1 predicted protein [Laccaria bicolor S238N-H82]
MSSLCTVPGMRLTSLSDKAKQSANSAMSDLTSLRWSAVMSSPICTSSNIFSTQACRKGSVWRVKIVSSGWTSDALATGNTRHGVSAGVVLC